jgi:hypothetical protein
MTEEYYPRNCDKCGQPVPRDNSCVTVAELALDRFIGFVMDRHLYPTGGCEGSPSRVRLVESDEVWKR